MKCFYTFDEKTGNKILIPMCYGSIHQEDKSRCCCPDPLTEHHFETLRYNDVVAEKNKTIEAQESELKRLRNILKSNLSNQQTKQR